MQTIYACPENTKRGLRRVGKKPEFAMQGEPVKCSNRESNNQFHKANQSGQASRAPPRQPGLLRKNKSAVRAPGRFFLFARSV
jgi:hypothetical protein